MSVTTSSSAENSPEECETGEHESDSAEFGARANWLNIILLKLAFIEIVFQVHLDLKVYVTFKRPFGDYMGKNTFLWVLFFFW